MAVSMPSVHCGDVAGVLIWKLSNKCVALEETRSKIHFAHLKKKGDIWYEAMPIYWVAWWCNTAQTVTARRSSVRFCVEHVVHVGSLWVPQAPKDMHLGVRFIECKSVWLFSVSVSPEIVPCLWLMSTDVNPPPHTHTPSHLQPCIVIYIDRLIHIDEQRHQHFWSRRCTWI